jgi:hypothetical protein
MEHRSILQGANGSRECALSGGAMRRPGGGRPRVRVWRAFAPMNCLGFNFQTARKPIAVIPGWSAGPDLRYAIAHRGISRFRVRCFASPRNDGVWVDSSPQRRQTQVQIRLRDPATRCARVVHLSSAPMEDVGNAGCPLHPRPRVHFVLVERTRVTTSIPESPGIPARNGLNGLCRAPGSFATVVHGYVLSKPGWDKRTQFCLI